MGRGNGRVHGDEIFRISFFENDGYFASVRVGGKFLGKFFVGWGKFDF